MIRTAEAVIDEHGTVRLLEPVQVASARRALAFVHANSRPSTPWQENRRDAYSTLARDRVA